jgi:two-component system cell cycle sensor histidine kinase/response regulator CckA
MTETKQRLKVFFLEDNPDDVELELHELQKGGFDISFEVAKNRKEFFEKLHDINADIVLADYVLPDITGIEAIHICQEKKIDVPIIFITGMGNEKIAVDSLREGAIDYILKKNIVGLSARVSRAMEIWAERKAKERADAEKQRFQKLLFQAQKMESVGRLASGIAHDFNNILTGILGFSELILQDTPEDSPFYEKLQTVITLCNRGAALVKQLLIFGRKIPAELKRTNINSFIEETMGLLKHAVKEGIEIKLNFHDGIPEIFADTGQLTQILINLTLNATDAMDGNGVLEFKTETYSIARDAGKSDEYVCLSVSDTGRGIPDYDIPKIFDPFFTTKEVGKGTGLGLTIVYSIVNSHGGWIKVDSELDKGTTFKIYLPAIQSGSDNVSARTGIKEDVEQEIMMSAGNETILFVEDEEELRTQCTVALSRLKYNVLSAKNSKEALDIYLTSPKRIDLVISDIIMPERSGMELFKELRFINPGVKLIFVTDYGLSEQVGYISREADAVIKKPYNIQEMTRMIRKVLDSPDS